MALLIDSSIFIALERDLIIAATALAHDLTLVSSDRRHFGSIADLSVALW